MKEFEAYTVRQSAVISVLSTIFITYPNVMWLPWNVTHMSIGDERHFWATFIFRCLFFFALFYVQIRLNSTWLAARNFIRRFGKNILFTIGAGLIFMVMSCMVPLLGVQSATVGKHLTFQFLVVALLCTFIGYISELNMNRSRREREIEQLKLENLESRYEALSSRINPHFFFNALNGISSLVQRDEKELALDYVSRLSDIFRYTLRSNGKQMATVADELKFVRAFAGVMEVRYGGKLKFLIEIPEKYMSYELPELSLLPLLENVSVHNRIDSRHVMTVVIKIENACLVVINNIYPKLIPADSNGTGLRNLDNRYMLMTGRNISIMNDGEFFKVSLPL